MCGWLSASKVLGMKLKNMTGYMLGNSNNVHCVGSAWSDVDCRVWVCATLDKAKRVLAESQRMCGLDPHVVWETIYQVSAKDIVCEKTNDGLWYTNTPRKITVNRVVYNKEARQITDADLIINARRQYGKYAQFMYALEMERKK